MKHEVTIVIKQGEPRSFLNMLRNIFKFQVLAREHSASSLVFRNSENLADEVVKELGYIEIIQGSEVASCFTHIVVCYKPIIELYIMLSFTKFDWQYDICKSHSKHFLKVQKWLRDRLFHLYKTFAWYKICFLFAECVRHFCLQCEYLWMLVKYCSYGIFIAVSKSCSCKLRHISDGLFIPTCVSYNVFTVMV